jgi:homocysteine S-methyltransferase
MSAAEAQAYHAPQIEAFAQTEADMVAAFTMNYTEEAIGITLAAKAAGMPVAISFTTETDGRLPSSETLDQAIGRTDAVSDGYPVYYMINCAHPLTWRVLWFGREHGASGFGAARQCLGAKSC